MEQIQTHWITILTLLVNCGVFKYLYNFLKEYKERDAARDDATRSLLRTEIINICHKAEEKGYLPIYNLENLNDMFRAYKALGGNGAISELYNHVKNYPHNVPDCKK